MEILQRVMCLFLICIPVYAEGRQWRDRTGRFTIDAELVGSQETTVVLKTKNGNLLAVESSQLCQADQIYVASTEAKMLLEQRSANSPAPTFKLINGSEVQGVVVGFAVHAWDILRRNGQVHVNDVAYQKLPKLYRDVLPAVVNHFQEAKLTTFIELEKWLTERGNSPKHYHVDSVVMRTGKNEFLYVPMFLFGKHSRSIFEEDFEYWKKVQEAKIDKATKEKYERDETLRLQYKYQLEATREAQTNYFPSVQLELLSLATGLTKLWEVSLDIPNGYSAPFSIIVSAPDSAVAEAIVLSHYPGMELNFTRVVAGY